MNDAIGSLFTSSFMPHGFCLRWIPSLLWTHVIADVLVALAYFSIPATIIYYLYQRKLSTEVMLQYGWIGGLFAAFILFCGITHVFGIITIWHPVYGIQSLFKAATAVVSVFTAIALIRVIPQALSLRSEADLVAEIAQREARELELKQSNARLQDEVLSRQRAEDAQREALVALQGAMARRNPETPLKDQTSDLEAVALQLALSAWQHNHLQIEELLAGHMRNAEPIRAGLDDMLQDLQRYQTLATDLRENPMRSIELRSFMQRLKLIANTMSGRVPVEIDCPPGLSVNQHAGDLCRALLQMLLMAHADARPDGSALSIVVEQTDPHTIRIQVGPWVNDPDAKQLMQLIRHTQTLRDATLREGHDAAGRAQLEWEFSV